jgi:prepilin peptidase dependent protein B
MMKRQRGLTLIEIMISLVLGLFLIAGILGIYVNTIKSSGDTLKSVRLNYDLDTVMTLMMNDIRRSGYSGGATVTNPNAFNNPFTTTATTLTIGNSVTTNDCILYTYDANLDVNGNPKGNGIVDANEYYGFRRYLNTTTNTHTIQIRASNVACNDTSAAWESITDENTLDITELRFSFASLDTADNSSPCTNPTAATCLAATSRCVTATAAAVTTTTVSNAGVCTFATAPAANTKIGQKRAVNIHLTGRLAKDPVVVKSLNSSVKVVNDRLYKQP